MKHLFFVFSLLFLFNLNYAQVRVMTPIESIQVKKIDYEYGYLPGGKFPFYYTIQKFDFKGKRLNIELFDDRKIKGLQHMVCSPENIENVSEFANEKSILRLAKYIDLLFSQSSIKLDTTSGDTIEIHLEALDSRIIGFGYARLHGLCQIRVRYANIEKTYCEDLMDGTKNSPIGKYALITRKSALRKMGSAAIRDVLEQFLSEYQQEI